MPRSIDLFIAADVPLEELATAIAEATGAEARLRPEGGAVLDVDGTVAVLSEHVHPDDAELRLSRYRYVLAAAVEAEDHIRETPEARMLRSAAAALGGDFDVLLVVDLQFRGRVATG